MAVPGGPGGRLSSAVEPDARDDPSPRVPKPLPERGRNAGRAAIALLVAVVILVVLLSLL